MDGGRHFDVAAPEPRFTALDHDPCCLEKLVENLFNVERIALTLFRKDPEQLGGHRLDAEDRSDHPLDLFGAQCLEGDRLLNAQVGQRHEARPCAQEEEDTMTGQADRQSSEELRGARVQPVHVLDQEHDRR